MSLEYVTITYSVMDKLHNKLFEENPWGSEKGLTLRFETVSDIKFGKMKLLGVGSLDNDLVYKSTETEVVVYSNKQFRLGDCGHNPGVPLDRYHKDKYGIFMNCHFGVLDVRGIDTSQVKSMQALFASCDCVSIIGLETWDTSQVEDMDYMFTSCYYLKDVNISNFNTSKVKRMCGMFQDSGMNIIGIDKLDTRNVTDMSYMFSRFNNEGMAVPRNNVNIDLSHFVIDEDTCTSYMFNGCVVNELNISSIDFAKTRYDRDTSYLYYALARGRIDRLIAKNYYKLSDYLKSVIFCDSRIKEVIEV